MHFRVFLLATVAGPAIAAIQWQSGDWAMGCDFRGNDLSNVRSSGEQCSSRCQATSGCTHYVWKSFNGGTCWLKKGTVSKTNAIELADKSSSVCGLISSGSNTQPSTTTSTTTTTTTTKSSGTGGSSATSTNLLGANYDAMHNSEYPLNGGALGNLAAAMDTDFAQMSKYVKFARTFYSNFYGVPVAPAAAKHGVKLYLGVFMTNEAWYQGQVQSAVDAVKQYPDTIAAIFVGNENLSPNGPYSANDIIARVNGIRNAVRQATGRSVPVGTVQRISEWVNNNIASETKKLADACDVIGVNIYPYFGGHDNNNPAGPLNNQWQQMIQRYGSSKIRLTETGFPTAGGAGYQGGPQGSLDTAKKYYEAVAQWVAGGATQNQPAFWFAFYDRRQDDNSMGNTFEKYFGWFTWDRKPKTTGYPRPL